MSEEAIKPENIANEELLNSWANGNEITQEQTMQILNYLKSQKTFWGQEIFRTKIENILTRLNGKEDFTSSIQEDLDLLYPLIAECNKMGIGGGYGLYFNEEEKKWYTGYPIGYEEEKEKMGYAKKMLIGMLYDPQNPICFKILQLFETVSDGKFATEMGLLQYRFRLKKLL